MAALSYIFQMHAGRLLVALLAHAAYAAPFRLQTRDLSTTHLGMIRTSHASLTRAEDSTSIHIQPAGRGVERHALHDVERTLMIWRD
jgi:hypothetical protein